MVFPSTGVRSFWSFTGVSGGGGGNGVSPNSSPLALADNSWRPRPVIRILYFC